MSYQVRIGPILKRQMDTWGLTGPYEFLVVDFLLRIDELKSEPYRLLRSSELPPDGILYDFLIVDPVNRMCQHYFALTVLYGQDEQTLICQHGGYWRFGA
jgi:hypothetical protein